MSEPTRAVFLSYASQDAEAARRICEALRVAGIEVWFDQSELRGGDAWDRKIRNQIHDCRLFIPVISGNSERRDEGYFRREWTLAADRTRDMAHNRAFLVPVVIDGTTERGASVPEKFQELQWTRLPGGETSPAFVERVTRLLLPEVVQAPEEATPPSEEFTRTAAASRRPVSSPAAPRRTYPLPLLIATVVIIGVGYLAVDIYFLSKRPVLNPTTASTFQADVSAPSAILEKSIAVLPFVDMSEKKDQEYFADGMAEEILDILATIPQLKVISRTSSFQFRGQNIDVRSVGTRLGVAYALEGSVRASGQRVRVTAQLIDTRDGSEVWSRTYDREVKDALIIQEEIAAALVRGLQVTIGADELQTQTSLPNAEAYEAYLRGRHALDRFDKEGFDEANIQFERALRIDPSSGRAADGLAISRTVMAQWGFVPVREGFEEARKAAELALHLNPRSFLGHAALLGISLVYDWNWHAAEQQRDEALQSDPQDSYVLAYASHLAMAQGNCAEALRFADAALAVDPLLATTHVTIGWIQLCVGNLPAAEAAMRRAIEISPNYVSAHFSLGKILLARGAPRAALSEMMAEIPEGGQTAGLALAYHALGRKADADAALSKLIKGGDWAYETAVVYAYGGEKDLAFKWLDIAYMRKDVELYLFNAEPILRGIHDDPRYKAFLRKMNLPEWTATQGPA